MLRLLWDKGCEHLSIRPLQLAQSTKKKLVFNFHHYNPMQCTLRKGCPGADTVSGESRPQPPGSYSSHGNRPQTLWQESSAGTPGESCRAGGTRQPTCWKRDMSCKPSSVIYRGKGMCGLQHQTDRCPVCTPLPSTVGYFSQLLAEHPFQGSQIQWLEAQGGQQNSTTCLKRHRLSSTIFLSLRKNGKLPEIQLSPFQIFIDNFSKEVEA